MNIAKIKVVARIISIALGIIFLLAAFSKILDPVGFMMTLETLRFPFWAAILALYFIPGIEMVLGACLIAFVWARETAMLTLILFIIFLFVGLYMNITGIADQGCGCIHAKSMAWFEAKGWWIVIRDFLLCFLALILWRSSDYLTRKFESRP